MRFSTLSIAGLAASASAAVLPRSDLGSWTFSLSTSSFANGFKSRTATAVYTSASIPEGITSTCSYRYNPDAEGEKEVETCDDGFSYEFDGETASLSQVVQLPNPNVTVFGSAPLKLTPNAAGRTFSGETTVEVTSATA